MKLKELIEKIPTSREATSIQLAEKCKSLIGLEIEIADTISDIREGSIRLAGSAGQEVNNGGDMGHVYLDLGIDFDKVKFEKQLISLSRNDRVRIIAKIKSIEDCSWERDRMSCILDLVSITVTKTNQEIIREAEEIKKVEERKEDIKNLGEAKRSGIIAIIVVVVIGFVVFLVISVILSIYNSFSENDVNISKIGLIIFILTACVAVVGYYNDFNLNRKK